MKNKKKNKMIRQYGKLRLAGTFSLAAFVSLFLTAAGKQPEPFSVLTDLPRHYHPDRVIATMKPPSSAVLKSFGTLQKAQAATMAKLASDENLSVVKTFSNSYTSTISTVLSFDKNQNSVEDVMKRLRSNPDVASVQPDFLYRASLAPNDPHYSKQPQKTAPATRRNWPASYRISSRAPKSTPWS